MVLIDLTKTYASDLIDCHLSAEFHSEEVRTDELCNLQEPDTVFACENLLQLLVADYNLLVLWILKVVLLDVGPNALKSLRARNHRLTHHVLHLGGHWPRLHDAAWLPSLGG